MRHEKFRGSETFDSDNLLIVLPGAPWRPSMWMWMWIRLLRAYLLYASRRLKRRYPWTMTSSLQLVSSTKYSHAP